MSGWISLHRSIQDNDLWLAEPFTWAQAWIDLLLNANHKPGSFWVRRVEIKLERGQLGWSEITMSERWKWSRGKVRRYLGMLETRGMIVQQKTQLTSVITICNYDIYQETGNNEVSKAVQQMEHQTVHQTDNRRYTNNNDNKDNKKNTAQIAQDDALTRTDSVVPFSAKQKPDTASAEFIQSQFERFYSGYKVKKDRARAEKCFTRFMKGKSESQVKFWTALFMSHYHHEFDSQTYGYEKLHPSTYLNNKRWEDNPEFMQQFKQDWIEYQQSLKTGEANGTTH